jgi:D-alanine-D-alanine ligase
LFAFGHRVADVFPSDIDTGLGKFSREFHDAADFVVQLAGAWMNDISAHMLTFPLNNTRYNTAMVTRVLVLAGGNSPEREVSARSGASVAAALKRTGYEVTVADPAGGLQNLLPALKSVDVVFPALHGVGGEDGQLQLFLEQQKIKFVGSGSEASELCFDKVVYDQLLIKNGILTPRTELVTFEEYGSTPLAKEPFVLKPNDGGSSIDTIIVRDASNQDEAAIRRAFDQHPRLLLQELISGPEITVAVLGTESLPVIEILPPDDQEFDYENKYNGATREICPPEHVSEEQQSTAQKLAERIHGLCGCRDMSRTDIIIGEGSKLYVLETNTIPGLTDQSLLPKAAAAAGIDMLALCDRLVRSALTR